VSHTEDPAGSEEAEDPEPLADPVAEPDEPDEPAELDELSEEPEYDEPENEDLEKTDPENGAGDGVKDGLGASSIASGVSADFAGSLDLPIVSAGNGIFDLLVDSQTGESPSDVSSARPAASATSSTLALVAGSSAASVAAALPFTPEDVSSDVRDASAAALDRELPDLVRDDGMAPFSPTEFTASLSGSNSSSNGATIRGVSVLRPASFTPSSSVLTGSPLHLS
jgi:hypothetical protein